MNTATKKILALGAFCLISPLSLSQTLQPWMSPEVGDAWGSGYKGLGTRIIHVDDFNSTATRYGNFNGTLKLQQHGKWTSQEARLIAPLAEFKQKDFSDPSAVTLATTGLNIVNLSYGMYANPDQVNQIALSAREQSIISHAASGKAVISKAAGNDAGTAVGGFTYYGRTDYLNLALINTKSVIFVGALDKNGTTDSKANIASYSNVAGANTAVQNRFLVVGVTGGNDPSYKLYGTSYAAPIISGYSAILGSKFTKANAIKISDQLLNTARTDTISNYSANVHGKGEASITRALAPTSIR